MTPGRDSVLRVSDWHALRKAVYYDLDYPASWVTEGGELAKALVGAGFAPLSAPQLGDWMRAQVEGGAEGSICFFARDVVPDTVAEVCSQDALLVQYLRAGGRVVWVGDVPFYYQGRRWGGRVTWGVHGQRAALGLESVWDPAERAAVTPDGTQWGLTSADSPKRCVPAAEVTAALTLAGRFAVSFFKNYNPGSPYSGLLRLSETMPLEDLVRAAQFGVEEEEGGDCPAPAPAPQAEETGAELVGTGTFLVDRSRALDKLMRFQLPDPQTCLLPLARCAEAAGSRELWFKDGPGTVLTVQFGGTPFTKEQLADPYAALFEPRTEANAAGRHLATALLCLLRLRPEFVTVSSGPAGARYRLRAGELGKESLQQSESSGGDTFVRIGLGGPFPGVTYAKLLRHVRARCQHSPLEIFINGGTLKTTPLASGTDGSGFEFVSGTTRGYIEAPPWPADASLLTVLVNGVSLDMPLSVKLKGLQVRGRLDSPDFTMNISQTGVVNNTRCSRAVGLVAAQLSGLVERVSERQRKTLHVAGRMAMRGGLAALWKERMSGARPLLPGLLSGLVNGAKSLLLWEPSVSRNLRENAEKTVSSTAASTRWLQEGCAALLDEWDTDAADPLLKTLWNAPVFLTVGCAARSLREIDEQRRKLGFVPYSAAPAPDAVLPFEVVWCSGYRELALLRRWQTVDITRKLAYYGRNPAAAEEFMGCSGSGLVAMRHDVELVPPDRPGRPGLEIKLSLPEQAAAKPQVPALPQKKQAPPPAPRPEARPPQPKPAAAPRQRKQPPLPDEAQLSGNAASVFPDYLVRLVASGIEASGARLLSQFIREQAADPGWTRKKLRAEILNSGLPPRRKAEYLLSVFYTELNRREVRFTDSDDIRFQQALADMILKGGDDDRKK